MDVRQDKADVIHLLKRFFQAVSFQPGDPAPYHAIRDMFIPCGLLVGGNTDPVTPHTVEDFIAGREEFAESGRMSSFFEQELAGTTESLGTMAVRVSRYEKRGVLDGTAFEAVGLLSTQFVRTDQGWRIVAMVWDDEREGHQIRDGLLSQA